MRRCCVRGCSNQMGHKFPKNPELRKLWIDAITVFMIESGNSCETSWGPGKWSIVCRDHFDASSYYSNGHGKSNNRLKLDAVPSIFHSLIERKTEERKKFNPTIMSASNIMKITSMELNVTLEKERTKPVVIKQKIVDSDNAMENSMSPLSNVPNKRIKFDKVLHKIDRNDVMRILKNPRRQEESLDTSTYENVVPQETPHLKEFAESGRVNLKKSENTQQILASEDQYEEHETVDHINCDVCKNKTFSSLLDLSNHQRTHLLNNVSKILEVGSYTCTLCKASFTTENILACHRIRSHNSRCDECGLTFGSLNNVITHKRNAHVKVTKIAPLSFVPVLLQVCSTCKSIKCSCEGGSRSSGKLLMSRRVSSSLKVVVPPARTCAVKQYCGPRTKLSNDKQLRDKEKVEVMEDEKKAITVAPFARFMIPYPEITTTQVSEVDPLTLDVTLHVGWTSVTNSVVTTTNNMTKITESTNTVTNRTTETINSVTNAMNGSNNVTNILSSAKKIPNKLTDNVTNITKSLNEVPDVISSLIKSKNKVINNVKRVIKSPKKLPNSSTEYKTKRQKDMAECNPLDFLHIEMS